MAEAKNGYGCFYAAVEGFHVSYSSYNPVEIEELDGILLKTGLRIEEIVAEVIKLEPDVIGELLQ